MKKKFLALVLTLAMVLSLVPVTALAVDGTDGGASQKVTKDNLTMTKTVTPVQNKDGTYTVRLESYATGEVTTTTTTKSSDIVLLLDVSGSMGDPYATQETYSLYKGYKNYELKYYSTTHWGLWYKLEDNTYIPVSVGKEDHFGSSNDKYTYSYTKDGKTVIIEKSTGGYTQPTTQFYYKTDANVTKMDALKEAVNAFIDDVAEKSPTSQISIVKFADDKTNNIGNDIYYGTNYTQIVKKLTKVDNAERVNQLKNAVSQLQASGSTASDYGLEKAQEALKSANRDKVVVLFTDGEPNHQNGFDYKVATDAVNTAKTLKQDKTTIYTVGVFKNPSDDINKYMSSVSSNYPDARATATSNGWKVTNGGNKAGTHYINAENAADLIKAFQTISSQVSSTHLNASAVVVDNVPSNFALTEGSVKVYTENCIAKNGETFKWDTKTESTIRPTIEDQSISVTGFNFSKNWCGLDENNQACGQKLIIEFTIKCTNYGGTQHTNDGAYIKAKEADEKPIISLTDPQVPVKVQLPDVSKPYTDTKTYDGAGFDIKDEISKIIAGLVPVDGIKNKFIDLTYEIKDNEGTLVGTYKIPAGQDTGTWSDTSTNITTGPNVGNYKYTITVTGQDTNKEQPHNYASETCEATFTITQKEVTFTGESDSLTWTGEEQTITDITAPTDLVPGHTYEGGLTYAATGTKPGTYNGKFTGSAIIKDAAGTDVTANYDVETEPGTLTITDSTSTANVTFKIVGGTWNGDNPTAEDKTVQVTLTNGKGSLAGVTIPTGSPSEDYTGAGTWSSSDENITGAPMETTEITKDTVFTLTYSKIEPVVTHVDVTFKIVGGKWSNGKTEDITRVVKLTNGTGSLAGVEIPTGVADADHQGDGTWSPATPEAGTVITQDGNKVFTLTFQEKEKPKPSDPVELDVSRSKTAAGLEKNSNGEWTTNVKLSLPSAEEQLASDVVFVLDKSKSAALEQQALDMLEKLKEQAASTGATVKVGVVIFNREAHETPLTDLATGYDTIKSAIEQGINGGTNTHAGLLAGKKMLDEDTEVSANRKYLIFVSDGITYMYNEKPTVTAWSFYDDEWKHWPGPDNWKLKYGGNNPPANWSTWMTEIGVQVKAQGTEYEYPYEGTETKWTPENDDSKNYANSIDKALYLTYQVYQEAQKEEYNCYAVVNNSPAASTYSWGPAFMNYLADGRTVSFSTIQNDILYAVSAGSTVTDTIGEKFTFGGVDSFTLKVGEKEIEGLKDTSDENTMNFGEKKSDGKYQGKYPYTVTYKPDTKTFVWTINEDVSNFAPVQLTYTVKLTNPKTAAGTYGVTDLNGDGKVDGTDTTYTDTDALYTNESATLVPVNSAGKQGQPLLFHKPSVSYTIKGSSGGHGGNGGGTVTIPDDVPTGLNGKDHYAYVVGYPDGMVYPQKNITRAEVATIFFRLLTDETREANMTKSNSYNDMKDGAWYTCAVSTLSKMGIIKGYEDGSFKPDASISRAEFAAIAARFDPDGDKTPATFSDVSSHWAKDEISIAANHGWIKGYEDGSFKPDQKITRAETMTLVNRVLKRLPETKDDLHKDMKTWPDNQNESAWFYLAVQEATNSHYQKLKKDGIHETWESMRETRDWTALEK